MRGTPIPFYHSLNKKTLPLGCNKEMLNLISTLSFALAFSGRFLNIYTDFIAIIFFLTALYFTRKISAVDPQIMEVYRRHIHLKKYYPPISGIHAQVPLLKPSVPYYEGKS
jgi:type IV secretory pathway TrbD component